jgi:GNAT superfamily N-acetyltransferase
MNRSKPTQTLKRKTRIKLAIQPLTPDRWQDLAQLFGKEGAVGGCWCMWWRLTPREFTQNAGVNNQKAFQKMVEAGQPVGLLAYVGGQPVGWCSVSPREQFIRLRTSATWKPIDTQPVWSIGCYFVHPDYRGKQIATRLLKAAVTYAIQHGADVIEAYPKDIGKSPSPVKDEALYFGTVGMYQAVGFVEVARRHASFPIMRLKVH